MMLPESGQVVGVFGSKSDLSVGLYSLAEHRMGCDIAALRALLRKSEIRGGDASPARRFDPVDDAPEAFAVLLDLFRHPASGMSIYMLAKTREWVRLRPQSVQAHLFLAASASARYSTDRSDDEASSLAESSYRAAQRLAPNSLLPHACYGHFLMNCERYEEALAALDKALAIEPENSFVLGAKMRALTETRPVEAEALGRRLVASDSENAHFWFSLAGALRERGKHDEAAKAARKAVDLDPEAPFVYRGRLADTLAKSGRVEEAEEMFKELLETHPSPGASWYWYAKFLIENCPKRIEEGRKALRKAEALGPPDSHPPSVRKEIEEMREKLRAAEERLRTGDAAGSGTLLGAGLTSSTAAVE